MAGLRPHVLSSGNNFSRIGYYTSLSICTSTESALLKVDGDIGNERATYERKCAVLPALDISAASDAVDHITMCRRADCEFGRRGIALLWLQSFVSDRSQYAATGLDSGTVRNHYSVIR